MKKIFEMSLEDAETFGHHAIGTQHLLIALLHEGQGVALAALRALGAPPEDVWVSSFRQLGLDAPPYVPAGLPSLNDRREPRKPAERLPTVALAAGAASFVGGLFVGGGGGGGVSAWPVRGRLSALPLAHLAGTSWGPLAVDSRGI